MSTLQTIDPAGTSEDLIPATPAGLEADLVDPVVRVYVYVGKAADPGWDAALTACGWLVGVRPYLASDISLLRKWVPTGNPSGIVFGSDDQPDRLLTDAEAAVEKIVRAANKEAA